MDKQALIKQLIGDEGIRLKPYVDTAGKLTIGIGRNLTDRGISQAEAYFLASNDIIEVCAELDKALPWWTRLDSVRQMVLADMAFNMGVTKLVADNPRMLAACEAGDYASAANEMLIGPWHEEVGARATRLSEAMRSGVIPGLT